MKLSHEQLAELVQRNPALRKRNPEFCNQSDRVASPAEPERSPASEPMAKIERETPCQERRLVRITVLQVKPIDGDNIYIKDVLDALKESGAIFDDSPKWCKVEVEQQPCFGKTRERTEITIEKCQ